MSHGNTLGNKAANDLGKRLLEAARHGNTEEVNNLMSSGAPLTTDWLGTTPLHLAAIYGHTSTAEALIKSGISRDGRTKVDKAPLHFACQHGHLEIVKLLVTGGAHVNAADMLKMTPLHWAVEANNFDICLLLLNAGVQSGFKNKFDKTPLRIARDKGYHAILKLLSDKKFQMLQDIDILHHNKFYDRNVNSVKICRTDNFGPVNNLTMKKPKTRRFPMMAGTWTGGEAQNQDRIEMMEQKKLGVFKKRTAPQQQPPSADIIPFLGSLHLSPAKDGKNPMTKQKRQTSVGSTVQGSPLQQLVETIRQSTYLNTNDFNVAKYKKNSPPKVCESSTSFTPQSKDNTHSSSTIQQTIVSSNSLYSGIPVISSLTLKSLPANIHAIPLSLTTDDLLEEKRVNSTNNLVQPLSTDTTLATTTSTSSPVSSYSLHTVKTDAFTTTAGLTSSHITTTSRNLNSSSTESVFHKTSPETQERTQHKSPVSLPADLLNQIMNGDITLHTLLSNNKNSPSDPSNIMSTFAGIKTEMGTIPIIPVSGGEGGLQLIPVENNDASQFTSHNIEVNGRIENQTTAKIEAPRSAMVHAGSTYPVVQPDAIRHPHVFVQNPHQAISKFPMYPPFHGVYNVGNGLSAQHQPISATSVVTATAMTPSAPGNSQSAVPTPMLVPTGVYLPPGHPGFLQIHKPHATPYGTVSTPQNMVVPSLYPSYGHGHHTPSAILPPVMHPGSHQIIVHPSLQPTFLQSHVQPHYIYLEGPATAGLKQNAMGVSATVLQMPKSPSQNPDSPT